LKTESTLPDWIGPGLHILSVGLNPSLNSLRAGFPFASPQNRFWKALNASGLIDEVLEPGVPALQRLFEHYRIGHTDVVKRATPSAAQLRVADFKTWAPQLTEKLLRFSPRIIWFHGKLGYRNFLRYGALDETAIDNAGAAGNAGAVAVEWGLQPQSIGISQVYLTPDPSSANATYSLDALILCYRKLAELNRSR
jgi:TDG/mug DNA glycosylase family protein